MQDVFLQLGTPSSYFVYLGRHRRHSHDKKEPGLPHQFLQEIINWTVERPGNKATQNDKTVGKQLANC